MMIKKLQGFLERQFSYWNKASELHRAIDANDIPTVQGFLDRKWNPNTSYMGISFFTNAIARNRSEIVQLFINHGADVNEADTTKFTPLMTASAEGNPDIVSKLLTAKADPNATDIHGKTPLTLATFNNQPEVVALLVRNGAKIDNASFEAVILNNAPQELIRLMIEKGADVNAKSKYTSPLHCAIGKNLETVKTLVDAGANIEASDDHYKTTPLAKAAAIGNIPVAEYLLEHNANINGTGRNGTTPLLLASDKNHLEMVEFLIGKNADVNATDEEGYTPLIKAAQKDHIEILCSLLEHGADIDLKIFENSRTALMTAVIKGKTEAIRALLQNDANVLLKDSEGQTALDMALDTSECRKPNPDIIRMLKSAEASQKQDASAFLQVHQERANSVITDAIQQTIHSYSTPEEIERNVTSLTKDVAAENKTLIPSETIRFANYRIASKQSSKAQLAK